MNMAARAFLCGVCGYQKIYKNLEIIFPKAMECKWILGEFLPESLLLMVL
jgi:hypothetical protein